MKDRFFYPLALMVIAGLITAALSIGAPWSPAWSPFNAPAAPPLSAEDIQRDGFELVGDTLQFLTPAPGTSFAGLTSGSSARVPVMIDGDGTAYVTLSAHIARVDAPPSAGVFANLSSAYKTAFAGQNIEISVMARQGKNNPSPKFELAYFAPGAGNTGWQDFNPGPGFSEFSFEYILPPLNGGGDVDYLGVWPDPDGLQRTIDVKWMRVRLAKPKPSASP